MQPVSDQILAIIVAVLFVGGLFSLIAGWREWRRRRARLQNSRRS